MPATFLADWLRSATDDDLAALVLARPDLATPPPADTSVLAVRAGAPGSVARASEELNTFELAVLDALLLNDADSTPVPRSELERLLAAPAAPALDRLRTLALVWGADDELRVVPSAREILGPFPAGLGRQVAALDGVDLAAVVAEVTDGERRLLQTLAEGPPIGRSRDAEVDVPLAQAGTPVQRLLARGLLVRRDAGTVELPRQLGVRLRGGTVFAASTLAEPALAVNPHSRATVDNVAAGEALELCRHVEALLASWSHAPPPVLKSGGLGVREVRRVMRELDVDEARVALLAELVVGAGLAVDSAETTPVWAPTMLVDTWLACSPAQRWTTLATAWLDLPRLPGLAYAGAATSELADKPPAPLSEQLRRPLAPAVRRRVLGALAALPAGAGVKSPEDLVAVLAWRAPRRGGRLRDETVRWTLAEAAGIGVMALGALPTATRALLADVPLGDPADPADDPRRRAASAMADAMPPPVDHVLVQADLTVVAPGQLEPELARDMAAVADVESSGHATVFRITDASVRRALDTGRTAAELHELFARASRTPVPQALSYLIDDVARRHGRLRGGVCASFLRCDDEVLVAEVLGNPVAAQLGLRKIAPTVLVSTLPLAAVLDGLRDVGFAPAAEGPDGRVVDLRPSGKRMPARSRSARRSVAPGSRLGPEQASAVVAHLRAGDRAASARRGVGVRNAAGSGDTSATLALLAAATRERREVWIGYVDAHGTAAQRIVTPVRVGSGLLEGADSARYPLHRITSAAFVED